MIDFAKQEINGTCPKCSASFRATIGQVSRQETITCRSCSQRIKLVDSNGSSKKGIRDINNAFDSLERTLKRFGK